MRACWAEHSSQLVHAVSGNTSSTRGLCQSANVSILQLYTSPRGKLSCRLAQAVNESECSPVAIRVPRQRSGNEHQTASMHARKGAQQSGGDTDTHNHRGVVHLQLHRFAQSRSKDPVMDLHRIANGSLPLPQRSACYPRDIKGHACTNSE